MIAAQWAMLCRLGASPLSKGEPLKSPQPQEGNMSNELYGVSKSSKLRNALGSFEPPEDGQACTIASRVKWPAVYQSENGLTFFDKQVGFKHRPTEMLMTITTHPK